MSEWRFRHRDGRYLLPNLRVLEVAIENDDHMRMFRRLLSPNLASVSINVDDEGDHLSTDRQLDYRMRYTFESLSLAPNLSSLAIYIEELSDYTSTDTITRLGQRLSSLASLNTIRTSPDIFARFTGHSLGRSLRNITIDNSFPIMWDQFKEAVPTIGKTCQAIHSLTLGINVNHIPILDNRTGVQPDVLGPLVHCTNLVHGTIIPRSHSPSSFLAHETLTRLVSAWSYLETLHLPQQASRPFLGRPNLSLATIAGICSSCPRLHSITITVEAETIPGPHNLPSNFLEIDFDESWIRSPQDVADWLGAVCRADGLRYSSRPNGDRPAMWQAVKDAVNQSAKRASDE
jgi:hypothetical protein